MKRLLVTHEAPDGTPRAYAVGPANDPDAVREAARYRLEAHQMECAVIGDPRGADEYTRREVVLA